MYQSFLNPFKPKILAADKMSSGIVFKPPIMLKTRFHNIAINRIKITAPSIAWSFIKARTITGKKAKIGMDWIISETGSIIRSVLGLFVIKRAMGIESTSAKT